MNDDDGLEGVGNITPPQDFFKEALADMDARMSILINYYKDGTIEYSIEHDRDYYGDDLDLSKVVGLLYHATETIIANARGETNEDD